MTVKKQERPIPGQLRICHKSSILFRGPIQPGVAVTMEDQANEVVGEISKYDIVLICGVYNEEVFVLSMPKNSMGWASWEHVRGASVDISVAKTKP